MVTNPKILQEKKKFSIGNDDYLIVSQRLMGKKPYIYFISRNGVWWTYGWKSKSDLLKKFPKIKDKIKGMK